MRSVLASKSALWILSLVLVLSTVWTYRYAIVFYGCMAMLRHSSDGNATLRVADTLEPIGPRIKELLRISYDNTMDDPRVRIAAASVLSKADRGYADRVVLRHLTSNNLGIVSRAIRDLWAMGASGHVDAILPFLKAQDPSLRESAALYLGLSARDDVRGVLRDLETSDPDENVRQTAARSLERINVKQ